MHKIHLQWSLASPNHQCDSWLNSSPLMTTWEIRVGKTILPCFPKWVMQTSIRVLESKWKMRSNIVMYLLTNSLGRREKNYKYFLASNSNGSMNGSSQCSILYPLLPCSSTGQGFSQQLAAADPVPIYKKTTRTDPLEFSSNCSDYPTLDLEIDLLPSHLRIKITKQSSPKPPVKTESFCTSDHRCRAGGLCTKIGSDYSYLQDILVSYEKIMKWSFQTVGRTNILQSGYSTNRYNGSSIISRRHEVFKKVRSVKENEF